MVMFLCKQSNLYSNGKVYLIMKCICPMHAQHWLRSELSCCEPERNWAIKLVEGFLQDYKPEFPVLHNSLVDCYFIDRKIKNIYIYTAC